MEALIVEENPIKHQEIWTLVLIMNLVENH